MTGSGQGRVRPQRRRRVEARSQELFGCSYEQYVELLKPVGNGKAPSRAFSEQKSNARKRGIEWQLKLSEWWAIWRDSGHWSERGCRAGNYVMCRKGDIGPYAVGNVFIGQTVQNLSDANKKSGLPLGVHSRNPGRFIARRQIDGKMTWLGVFDTAEAAAAAYQGFIAKGRKSKAPVRESERA